MRKRKALKTIAAASSIWAAQAVPALAQSADGVPTPAAPDPVLTVAPHVDPNLAAPPVMPHHCDHTAGMHMQHMTGVDFTQAAIPVAPVMPAMPVPTATMTGTEAAATMPMPTTTIADFTQHLPMQQHMTGAEFTQHLPINQPTGAEFTQHLPINQVQHLNITGAECNHMLQTAAPGDFVQHMPVQTPSGGEFTHHHDMGATPTVDLTQNAMLQAPTGAEFVQHMPVQATDTHMPTQTGAEFTQPVVSQPTLETAATITTVATPAVDTAAAVPTPHATTATPTTDVASTHTGQHRTVDLDLSSATDTSTLGHMLNGGTVTVTIGGTTMVVDSNTVLTPAEKVAAIQVLTNGRQDLILNADGSAAGGSMVITPWLSTHLGNLVIPQGVSVTDLSSNGTLNITGTLSGAGNLYIGSANGGISDFAINAAGINLGTGGLISNIMPADSTYSNLGSSVFNLSLYSLGDIFNSGSILSSGNLSLSALGSILSSASGILQAGGDISLSSGAGNITNSGLVLANMGNIGMFTMNPTTNLNVYATGGTFQALNGNINFNNAQYTGSGDLNVTGGDWKSKEVNFQAYSGTVKADVGEMTGMVNVKGGASYITAATEMLALGNIDLSGDPTFYNSLGSVSLGAVNVSGDLAIIASQDIIATSLTSAPGSGQSGHMTLVAGANITSPSPATNNQVGPDTTTTVTVSGGSTTGGSIRVSGDINTGGGNLVAVAYNGTGAGSSYAPGTINIGGSTNTSRGNITMIAGATTGTGIQTGSLQSSGVPTSTATPGNAGSITLITATPIINSGSFTVTNGTPSNLTPFQTTGLTSTGSSISTGGILAAGAGAAGATSTAGGAGGAITIQSGGTTSTGYIRAFGGGGGGSSVTTANVSGGNGGAGGSINITSAGAVSITADVNTSGGGGGGTGGYPGGVQSVGGAAGDITINATSSIDIAGPVLAAGGGRGGLGTYIAARGLEVGGVGGGGSFGGGGGASGTHFLGGGGGGGGFTGGGGSGAGSNDVGGGAGSGGGYSYGGGGGGGAQAYPFYFSSGGGGGGGGLGVGGGGGGAGGSNFTIVVGGGNGGAGGGNGGTGTNGAPAGFAGGGGGSPSGGNGEGGQSVGGPTSRGGGGGGGGLAGASAGTGGAGDSASNNGQNGGFFGQGGGGASGATQATGVGTSGAGGHVTIAGQGSVNITGKISDLATITGSTAGFTGLSYSNDSVNVMGTGGTINISVTSPTVSPIYFPDANYGSGATTYLLQSGGLSVTGNLQGSAVNTITLNGTLQATASVTGPISMGGASGTILEGSNTVTVGPGSMVTPAEYIAFLQKYLTGTQSLILSQTASGTTPGTGYASGGDFTVASINIPATNFTNLVLPSSVTENVTAPSITYTGNATINGILNLNSGATALNVGGTSTLGANAQVNFNDTTGGLFNSTGGISAASTSLVSTTGTLLTFQSTGNIRGAVAGDPLNFTAGRVKVNGGNSSIVDLRTTTDNVRIEASTASSLTLTGTGNVYIAGDINSMASPGSLIQINVNGSLLEDSTPGRLYATTVNLNNTGTVGSFGDVSRILTHATFVNATSTAAGQAMFLETDASTTVTANNFSTFNMSGSANNIAITVGAAGLTTTDANPFAFITNNLGSSSIALNGNVTAAVVGLSTGTGGITGSGNVTGSTGVDLATTGGNIGASGAGINTYAPTLNLRAGNTGDVFIFGRQDTTMSTGSIALSEGVRNLTYTNQNPATGLNIGSAGIASTGSVTINSATTNFGITLTGGINAATTASLSATGTGGINAGSASGVVRAGTSVVLQAASGQIGTTGNPVQVSTPSITILANGTGSQFIRNQIAGTVESGTAAAGYVGVLDYMGDGLITVGSNGITGTGSTMNVYGSSGSNVGIQLNGLARLNNAGATTINLQATGIGTITQVGTTARVQANTANLYTAGGNIGTSSQAIVLNNVAAVNTQTNGTGEVWVTNNTAASINASSVGNYNYTSTADVSTGVMGINSTGNVSVKATNISVPYAVNANTSTGTVTLEATSGNITGAANVNGQSARLLTAGGTIGTGTGANALNVNAANIYLDTDNTGNVFVNGLAATSNLTTGTGVDGVGRLNYATSGDTTIGTAGIEAHGDVDLNRTSTSLATASYLVDGSVNTFGNSLTVRPGSAGNVQQLGTGRLTASEITLDMGSGYAGDSASPLRISTPTVRVVGTSATAVNLTTDTSTNGTTMATAIDSFTMTGTGANTTLSSTGSGISALSNLTLQGSPGVNVSIDTGAGLNSSTASGNVVLNATGAGTITNSLGDTINGYNITLHTEGGDIGSVGGRMIVNGAGSLTLGSNSTGNAYVDTVGTTLTTTSSTDGVGSLNLRVTNANGVVTIGNAGVYAAGDLSMVGTSSNNGFVLDGETHAGSTATITATGTGSIQRSLTSAGTIFANSAVITTASGDIGTLARPVNFSASDVDLRNGNQNANFYVTNDLSANLSVGTSANQRPLSLVYTSTGTNTTTSVGPSGINAFNSITLQDAAGTNGSFDVTNDIRAFGVNGLVTISTLGDGTITQSNPAARITASAAGGRVDLSTAGGNIGALGSEVGVTAATSTYNTGSPATGDVWVDLYATSSTIDSSNVHDITARLVNAGTLYVGNININGAGQFTTLPGSTIDIYGDVGGSSASTITFNSGEVSTGTLGTSGYVTANRVEFVGQQDIGSGLPVQLRANDVYFEDVLGNVSVTNDNSATVQTYSSTASNMQSFSYQSTGSSPVTTTVGALGITATDSVVIASTTGWTHAIDLQGDISVNPATGIVLLTSGGSGAITNSGDKTITGAYAQLATEGADIGSASHPMIFNASNIDVSTFGSPTTGDAYVTSNIDAVLTSSGGLGNLVALQTGSGTTLTLGGNGLTLQGLGDITVTTAAGSDANVDIGDDVTAGAMGGSNTISITVEGTGQITNGATGSTGNLSATNLNLTTGGGDIGISGSDYMYATANNVTFHTNSTGLVGMYNNATTQVVQTGSSTSDAIAGLFYEVDANGPSSVTVGATGITSTSNGVDIHGDGGFGSNTSIDLAGNIDAPFQSVYLEATGSGNITNSGGALISAFFTGYIVDNGSVGSSGGPMQSQSTFLGVHSYLNDPTVVNSAYLVNQGNAGLLDTNVSGTFSLNNNGNLAIIQDLRANHTNGGSINLTSSGLIAVAGGARVQANGTSGSGGTITFSSSDPTGDLTVINDGAISARNGADDSGRVGFQGGASGMVDVSGGGTIHGGEFVSFGDLDPGTLLPVNGAIIPPTASYSAQLVSFSQSAIIGNQIRASFIPPPPVNPTTPTSNTTGNPNALAAFFAFLQQSLLNQQTITLNEQLGTRIATDYTPVYPQNHVAPTRLQGGIAVDNNGRMPGQAMFGATNFNAEELLALTNNGVVYGPHTGEAYINLLQGYVLFAPERDIEVEVREGKIYIPKGAIAWVMETGADSAIYDLHDTMQTGPIRVVANNKTLTLGPGQQVLLTRNMNATFAELNPGSVVGYRNVRSTDMGSGIKSYICEFSIPHGLNNVEVINGLLYSKEDKHQKIVKQMLKNAAILADLSAQKYRNK